MAKLAGTVYVTNPAGAASMFGPDDEVPGWAVEQITNPKAWAVEPEPPVDDAPVPATDEAAPDYQEMKVADLRALIAARNEGREEGETIPDDGVKADLVAALEADDESG